jgi:ABC-type transporter Mla maintaining outer membrane lipid asymmetry permease subunit MlaE
MSGPLFKNASADRRKLLLTLRHLNLIGSCTLITSVTCLLSLTTLQVLVPCVVAASRIAAPYTAEVPKVAILWHAGRE